MNGNTLHEIEVDLGRYELRRGGRRIKLEKKPMDLLILLVSRREQLVTRDEIVKKLWRSDLFIDTEMNVNNVVRKLRTALGDNADKPRFLETVVGRGYRFVGPARVIDAKYPRVDPAQESSGDDRYSERKDYGQRPSIAVVPLLLLGNAHDDQGLCLGFADALVALLANLPGVDVLPTEAVMNLPLEASAEEIASRAGVRFVFRGAIQMVKEQWRLSVELCDTLLQRTCFRKKCDVDLSRLANLEAEIAKQIASALNRPQGPQATGPTPRHSRDPMAYADFMRGYRIAASGDSVLMDQASHHLTNAVTRDPNFALAHATLSFACAARHFEYDSANVWLEKAEFHCKRALEIDPKLAEAYVARAYLLWGPSKNFQHVEAIADLKHALSLQSNLPRAYNRLGTILCHIGLLDHAREMFERARPFHPRKEVSPSVLQVYVWGGDYEAARKQVELWRAENPGSKYALHFGLQRAILSGDWDEGDRLVEEAVRSMPDEPLFLSLHGVLHALRGNGDAAMECVTRACASPKTFGHTHHTYYQIACVLALTGRRQTAFEWLERSVSTGFACWPFFLKDPCLQNLRALPEFEVMVSTLQAKYPDHIGLM
ncbi:MAG TPA: winged helix-turn-helix domain-containing protein [Candidatus Solibacter sp.]|nr:winged helix-turn-helix domain-containing protein [Candidatus Solibacter sp.]